MKWPQDWNRPLSQEELEIGERIECAPDGGAMGSYEDLTGSVFGRLLAIEKSKKDKNGWHWLCECKCGNTKTVLCHNLTRGLTKSCGCYHRQRAVEANTTHGLGSARKGRNRTYRAWESMRGRCYRPKDTSYRNYGARGIKVCERWRRFENFLEDMGECPDGMQIDRINVNGDYEKSNCRWVTAKENNRNKRNSRIVEYRGEKKALAEWVELFGLKYGSVLQRLNSGWSVDSAFDRQQ